LPTRTRILITGGDPATLEWLGATAAQLPAEVRLASTGADAEELSQLAHPHVVATDLVLPDMTFKEFMDRVRVHVPHAQVIVVASHACVAQAVEVMRAGAFTLLEQPIGRETLLATLDGAIEEYRLRRDERRSNTAALAPINSAATSAIVGRTRALRAMLDTLRRVAPSEANCLITGENGTGKELVADAIHASSPRAAGPFVKINCAAIPSELLESELFGHKRGSFTDAVADREGLFERANGGSLFLDEIAEIPPFLQAKLLRVLEDRAFRPVGGTHPVVLDARLICATNVDIGKAVREGRLREDLLFRVNTITLQVPPLRERTSDLPLLCAYFLEKFSERHDRRMRGVSSGALRAMSRYRWPGNIRELENVIERAVLLSATGEIDLAALPHEVNSPVEPRHDTGPALMTLDQIERRALLDALERAKWNKQVAAAALGIYRPTLYSKMRKYAIVDPSRGARARAADLGQFV
jgi:DNA-binding NtrC family response regulator